MHQQCNLELHMLADWKLIVQLINKSVVGIHMKKLVRVFMKLDIDLLLQNMDTAHR